LRILLTGAAGFVGRHLSARLLAAGHEITGLDLPGAPAPAGVLPLEWDLAEGEGLAERLAELKPEAVLHLAAQSAPRIGIADPLGTFHVNVTGTLRLLEALREGAPEARLLFASSSEVYAAGERPHREEDALGPANPYGSSKAAGEILVLQYARSEGLDAVVSRGFPHSGPGQRPDFALPAFARQIARVEADLQEPVIRVGNLEARRDWLDVRDVVAAYEALLEKGSSGEIYNVCSGEDHGVGEALDYLVAAGRREIRVETDPALLRPLDLPRHQGDAGKLRAATGWEPSIGFEAMLDDLLADWRRRILEEESP